MARKIKVAVYYRVSKKSKNNIRMQRKVCKDFLKNKKYIEFYDKGYSGRTKNRPALNKLLTEIDNKNIDSLVVYKIDRLGRDFSQLNNIIEKLDKNDIRLTSATQNFDNKTPEGKFMLRLLTILAEFESGMISKRTIDGLRAAGK